MAGSSLFPAEISFPLTPLQGEQTNDVVVLRREYRMDAARVRLSVSYEEITKYVAAGSPLVLRWGSQFQFDEFVGYVHSFRPSIDGITKSTEIIAISAAYPMVNESGRTYTGVGIHNVAQDIAEGYRFQIETDPHPYIHDQILQKSESDWTLLARLAEQWGYVLMMDGITLVFRPLSEVLEENYRFSFNAKTSDTATSDPRANILFFEESYTASGRQASSGAGLFGVDPIGLNVINQRDPDEESYEIFEQINPNRSVTSNLEGELKTTAKTTSDRFPYEARATLRAAYRRKPFDCYRILHNGQRRTWVIRSVRHVISGNDYLSEMVLGSDGEDHSAHAKDSSLDISTLLKRSRRVERPRPVIVNNRPYLVGAGANVIVPDQRWKAELFTTPPDLPLITEVRLKSDPSALPQGETARLTADFNGFSGTPSFVWNLGKAVDLTPAGEKPWVKVLRWGPKSEGRGFLAADLLTNPARWTAHGFGYDNTQPAPVAVTGGMRISWTQDTPTSKGLQGVAFTTVIGTTYTITMTVTAPNGSRPWRLTAGWGLGVGGPSEFINPTGLPQTVTIIWRATESRSTPFGIEMYGQTTAQYVVNNFAAFEHLAVGVARVSVTAFTAEDSAVHSTTTIDVQEPR